MGIRCIAVFLIYFISTCMAAADDVTTIAFGSCLKQWKPQPVWQAITTLNPDLFLLIGDNVYADTMDIETMRKAYAQLASKPGYQKLLKQCPVYATWDDHDYGQNDAGFEYPMRAQSQQIFLDFFNVPEHAPTRQRQGVYSVQYHGASDRRVQIILLDTRYFRSSLKLAPATPACRRGRYVASDEAQATVLGQEQWSWLQQQLKQPARVRVIASSIQVIADQHCYEKWANFPDERQRLFDIIRASNASGVILISGDRHLGEISMIDGPDLAYPLYEITSSGMNSGGSGKGEINRFRVNHDNYNGDNFGSISIGWSEQSVRIRLNVHDVNGKVVRSHEISLSDLQ